MRYLLEQATFLERSREGKNTRVKGGALGGNYAISTAPWGEFAYHPRDLRHRGGGIPFTGVTTRLFYGLVLATLTSTGVKCIFMFLFFREILISG
jgi:hypothetical protein